MLFNSRSLKHALHGTYYIGDNICRRVILPFLSHESRESESFIASGCDAIAVHSCAGFNMRLVVATPDIDLCLGRYHEALY